jgi:hypothetical protein
VGEVEYVEVFDARGRLLARHRIEAWPVTIGRGLGNAVIVDDRFVCPDHLRVDRNGSGGLQVEDLGSVNGTFYEPSGTRLGRAPLAAGARIRIGSTVLRFVGRGHPVVPTVPYHRADDGTPWVARRPMAQLVWLAVPFTIWLHTVLDQYERQYVSRLLGTDLLMTVVILFWAAAWALLNRLVSNRWRLPAHAAVACAFILVDAVPEAIRDYARFVLDGEPIGSVVWAVFAIGPLAWLLGAHLAVVGAMPPRKRRVVAMSAALGTVALAMLAGGWTRFEFSNDVEFESTLRPFPRAWLPATSVDALGADVDELATEVGRLATER